MLPTFGPDTNSFSLVVRDVFFDYLDRDPFFANYVKRKTKMRQVQPNLIPYLGVYFMGEGMTPDGDANAGSVSFNHTFRIGFSVIHVDNGDEDVEATLDRAFWRIMHMWKDQYVMNRLYTWSPNLAMENPGNTRLEGIPRGDRNHVYGSTGLNNETAFAEMQYTAHCFYRSYWEPIIVDDFTEIRVKTGVKIGETEEEMAKRLQVEARHTFPQDGE